MLFFSVQYLSKIWNFHSPKQCNRCGKERSSSTHLITPLGEEGHYALGAETGKIKYRRQGQAFLCLGKARKGHAGEPPQRRTQTIAEGLSCDILHRVTRAERGKGQPRRARLRRAACKRLLSVSSSVTPRTLLWQLLETVMSVYPFGLFRNRRCCALLDFLMPCLVWITSHWDSDHFNHALHRPICLYCWDVLFVSGKHFQRKPVQKEVGITFLSLHLYLLSFFCRTLLP